MKNYCQNFVKKWENTEFSRKPQKKRADVQENHNIDAYLIFYFFFQNANCSCMILYKRLFFDTYSNISGFDKKNYKKQFWAKNEMLVDGHNKQKKICKYSKQGKI